MNRMLPSHSFAPCMRETRRGRSRSLNMDLDCLQLRTIVRLNLTSSRNVSDKSCSPRRLQVRMSSRGVISLSKSFVQRDWWTLKYRLSQYPIILQGPTLYKVGPCIEGRLPIL